MNQPESEDRVSAFLTNQALGSIAERAAVANADACRSDDSSRIPVGLTQEEVDHIFDRRVSMLKESLETVRFNAAGREDGLEYSLALHRVRLIEPFASTAIRDRLEAEFATFVAELDAAPPG